ncbi:MAG: PGF-CTERM sorting domain-containing protein [archaeon]|nr:PGF-CTERM sorting domain-containing protein [archaeon]
MTTTAYFPEELPGNYSLTNMTDGEVAKASYENANGCEVVVSLSRGINATDAYEEEKKMRGKYSEIIDGTEYTRLTSFRPTVGFLWICDNETLGILHIQRSDPYVDVEKIIIAMQAPKPTSTPQEFKERFDIVGVMYDSETEFFVDGDTVRIYEYSIPYSNVRDDVAHNCEQVSFNDIRGVEVLTGKALHRWNETPEDWWLCAWGNETHTYMGSLPPKDVKHASVYGSGPVSEVTLEGLVEMTVERSTPGFEAVFAIAGMLAVAYLVHRRKR